MKSVIFIAFISLTLHSMEDYKTSSKKIELDYTLSVKEQAFQILKTKCNVCHEKKNKKRVFTLDNMNRYSKRIYRQVFKFKRMPKGDEIKLTDEEYTQLKKWIFSLNKKIK